MNLTSEFNPRREKAIEFQLFSEMSVKYRVHGMNYSTHALPHCTLPHPCPTPAPPLPHLCPTAPCPVLCPTPAPPSAPFLPWLHRSQFLVCTMKQSPSLVLVTGKEEPDIKPLPTDDEVSPTMLCASSNPNPNPNLLLQAG